MTKDPIITKSHELRDLSKFINDASAVEQMEERRSVTAGFALSDAVGVQRLHKALSNIERGQILKIIASDQNAVKDLKAFCEYTDHEFIDDRSENETFIIRILKG